MAAYSQEVVVKARRGDEDYVKHAICLYPDFPAFLANVSNMLSSNSLFLLITTPFVCCLFVAG